MERKAMSRPSTPHSRLQKYLKRLENVRTVLFYFREDPAGWRHQFIRAAFADLIEAFDEMTTKDLNLQGDPTDGKRKTHADDGPPRPPLRRRAAPLK